MNWNYCQTINFQSYHLLRYAWPEIEQNQKTPVMPKTTKAASVRKVKPKPAQEVTDIDILFSNTPIIRKHRVLPNRTNEKKILKWLIKPDKA